MGGIIGGVRETVSVNQNLVAVNGLWYYNSNSIVMPKVGHHPFKQLGMDNNVRLAFRILVGLASGIIVGVSVVTAIIYRMVKNFQTFPLD